MSFMQFDAEDDDSIVCIRDLYCSFLDEDWNFYANMHVCVKENVIYVNRDIKNFNVGDLVIVSCLGHESFLTFESVKKALSKKKRVPVRGGRLTKYRHLTEKFTLYHLGLILKFEQARPVMKVLLITNFDVEYKDCEQFITNIKIIQKSKKC